MSKPIIPRLRRCISRCRSAGRCRALWSCQFAASQSEAAFNIMSDAAAVPAPDHKTSGDEYPFALRWRSLRSQGASCLRLSLQSRGRPPIWQPRRTPVPLGGHIVSATRGTPVFPGFLGPASSNPAEFRRDSAPRALISYQSVMQILGQSVSSTN